MPQIFVSYSRKDADWFKRLYQHLRPLAATGAFELWSDADIPIGQNWDSAIRRNIESASIAVLLVSPDYLASDFINKVELPRLVELAKTRDITIIPVILKPTQLPQDLRAIQFVPGGQRTLSELPASEQEVALAATAEVIRHSVTKFPQKHQAEVVPDPYSKALSKALTNAGVSGSMNISGSANIFVDAEAKLKKGN